MRKKIQYILFAVLFTIGVTVLNAQDIVQTSEVAKTTGGSTKKVEQKAGHKKSNEDSWTGFYLGGYGRFSDNRATAISSTVYDNKAYFSQISVISVNEKGIQKLKLNSFDVGGTFGYNYQKGKMFVGGEIDLGLRKINSSKSITAKYDPTIDTPLTFTIIQSVKSNWILSARPRGGIALRKALLYLTGGLAVTNIKYQGNFSSTDDDTKESGSFSKLRTGWAAGGGIEFKAFRQWSVKAEYLFSQFGRNGITSTNFALQSGPCFCAPNSFNHSTDLKSHSIRFGINYRF